MYVYIYTIYKTLILETGRKDLATSTSYSEYCTVQYLPTHHLCTSDHVRHGIMYLPTYLPTYPCAIALSQISVLTYIHAWLMTILRVCARAGGLHTPLKHPTKQTTRRYQRLDAPILIFLCFLPLFLPLSLAVYPYYRNPIRTISGFSFLKPVRDIRP